MRVALVLAALVLQADAPSAAETACPNAADMKLLQALRQRRLDLDAREAELNERQAALEALRKQLDERLTAMAQEVSKLEERLMVGEGARSVRERRIAALVEALTSLSARKAAPMLAAADPNLVSDLLLRMGPSRTAALLALMPTQRAARLMEEVGADNTASDALQKKGKP